MANKKKDVIKNQFIQIRLTENEKSDFLKRVPDNYNTSKFIFDLVMGQPIQAKNKRPIYTTSDPELIKQVARIGVNVNQITRSLHQAKIEHTELFYLLAEISEQLDIIIEVKNL